MGQQPELHLGIIRGYQFATGGCDKDGADIVRFAANRNILQIGVRARETPRRGDGLIITGMDTPGFGAHLIEQSLDVRAFILPSSRNFTIQRQISCSLASC